MDPLITASLIGIGGGLLGSAANIFNQRDINQQNVNAQNRSNELEIQLANTAFQRSKQDMLAANLNPALMYGAGSPAMSPNVDPAMQQMLDIGSGFGSSAESLSRNLPQLLQLNQQLKGMELSQLETVARTKKIYDDLKTSASLRGLQLAQTELTKFQTQSRDVTEVLGRMLDSLSKKANPGFWDQKGQGAVDSLYNFFNSGDVAPLFQGPQQ